jgi:hypothetical protein
MFRVGVWFPDLQSRIGETRWNWKGAQMPHDVHLYSTGVRTLSVCAPATMSREEIESIVNALHPTGIPNPWRVSNAPKFPMGGRNPGPCENDPARRHYLMTC